jgi:hypothetical protein
MKHPPILLPNSNIKLIWKVKIVGLASFNRTWFNCIDFTGMICLCFYSIHLHLKPHNEWVTSQEGWPHNEWVTSQEGWPHKRGGLSWGGQSISSLLSQCRASEIWSNKWGGLITGVTSLREDSPIVFYYLSAGHLKSSLISGVAFGGREHIKGKPV